MPNIRDVKKISVGADRVRRVWYEGRVIWPVVDRRLANFRGLATALMYAEREKLYAYIRTGGVDGSKNPSITIDENWWNTCAAWMVVEEKAVFALQQGDRNAVRVERTGSTVEVSSTAKEGETIKITLKAPENGVCLVKVDMNTQWYGYWLRGRVYDATGAYVETKDTGNGGGFKKGRTAFEKGEVTVFKDSAVVFSAWRIGGNTFELNDLGDNFFLKSNKFVEVVQKGGPWEAVDFFPPDLLDVYIVSGGQGGSSDDGYDGPISKLPPGVTSGRLTVGAGGRAGSGFGSGGGGKGGPTTLDVYTSAMGGIAGIPRLDDYTRAPRLGAGGMGYRRDSDGSTTWPSNGSPGGLVAVYSWEKQ
ncbi:hypothetical protein FRC0031_00081 [Corynebacterium diphtheriae]|nr:hypothetical protein FRC0037_00082 [Corynebacterium diphtheriae]CAB0673445.1 hypothetical protein FRC0031_00081 [Corynebacterium diphtheriae]